MVVHADHGMDGVERPARALCVRNSEVGPVARVLVVVGLREEVEAAAPPRSEVDRQDPRRLRRAERDERGRDRRLQLPKRAHELT